ncbi:dimethylargininase [Nakamurella panacisegetis]|uniref:Dimethylargininase n=1 Tax=Nakamurella panacisegetis TaxID=1090615 RepID=A0A1H0HGW8_9ACTN|nr:dimethylargininase [Nakamurella panacisegetis]SDO18402.1 dimethylargininase [Nakamurella panacisegetis]
MPFDAAPDMSRRALIRRPSPRLAQGLVTHIDRSPIDIDLAGAQWQGYVDALTGNGWHTIEVDPAFDCPDSVFVEDAAVMFGGTAVITNPGADERKPETAGTAAALRDLGYPVRTMTAGSLDGGDVLKIGSTVYVGRGGRTDAAGIAEFRAILEPLGGNVIAVPLTKALHLKSAVTALPDGTVIGYPPVVDDPSFYPHFRPMPEEGGAHVVDLGQGRLLMAASAPRSADLIADLGYTPVVVDISEFEKMEGCVTCLSVRLRSAPSGS